MTAATNEIEVASRAIRTLRRAQKALNQAVDDQIDKLQVKVTRLINANRQAAGLEMEE